MKVVVTGGVEFISASLCGYLANHALITEVVSFLAKATCPTRVQHDTAARSIEPSNSRLHKNSREILCGNRQ